LVVAVTFGLAILGVAGPVTGFIITAGLGVGIFSDSFAGFRIPALGIFAVGDLIEIKGEDVRGEVQRITLSGTVLKNADGAAVHVPNRKIFDRLIVNHSKGVPTALKVLHFRLVLDSLAGIDRLKEQILAAARSMPSTNSNHPIGIRVTLIEANATTFTVQFSAKESLATQTASEFLKVAKAQFDNAGVGIRSLSTLP